jgi:peptidoglycan/LPS O-acetylase OafA/YrhL
VSAANPAHLRSLTGLRFIAASLVVVHHLSIYALGLGLLGKLAAPGYVGVSFFFVLSGFVLTFSWDSDASAGRFYRRRFARVYPVHLLFVVVAMLPLSPPPNWSALPANLLLVQSWSPDLAVARSFSGVSWSLSCEMFFYAVFPWVVRHLWRVRWPLLLSGVLVAAAMATGVVVQSHSAPAAMWIFQLPAFRVVEFTCGALAAVAVMRGWAPRLNVWWSGVLVLTSYLTILVLPVVVGYHLEDRWAFTLAMVPSFVALVSACAHRDLEGKPSALGGRAFVTLGQWSFGIYMAHPIVLSLTAPLLAAPTVLGALLGCSLVALTIAGVSFAVYVGFERPLERRIRGKDAPRVSDMELADELSPAPEAAVVRPKVLHDRLAAE